jgi:hypothetical protein
MPGMPYVVEVGAVLSALTEYCKEEKHLQDTLKDLRDTSKKLPDLLASVGATRDMVDHFAKDWLGYRSASPMTQQAPFDPTNPKSTGWWTTWYGNAEGILRETMIRAIEVALGIPHDGDPRQNTHCWRVTFTWTCAAPMLQGWVYWWDFDYDSKRGPSGNGSGKGNGRSDDGIVNVIFSTPGNGHPLYATPYRPGTDAPPDYDNNPTSAEGDEYGLWVIGEDRTDVRLPDSTKFTGLGHGVIPEPWPNFFHTGGDMVTVSPAEVDGGVKHAGDHFD